jgi:alanyl-tRNA synthetase
MNTAEIRQRFVGYYEDLGYQPLPSASMIDPSIPMSFVMSAGLVQVENSLAKSTKREGNQFVLVQSCFRHFDLDKVGVDNTHLSLFEMPGAFVFGHNGKAGTIQRMWTLATSVLGIDANRIWVSYFKGDDVLHSFVSEDSITRQAWLNVGIPENRLVGLGAESNYWIQGKGIHSTETIRKCGPNTELFFDRGEEKACGQNCKPGCSCGRFVEFSNSLFISSEIDPRDATINPINTPFTETVIGSERVAMICQKVRSVFETSDLEPIIETIHRFVSVPYLSEIITAQECVIADHLKGLYYLMADGAPPPGKDGRARIIKMLIRRVATRQIMLGISSEAFLPAVLQRISQIVPSNMKSMWIQERFTSCFLSETQRFSITIERGIHQLSRFLKENGNQTLSGLQVLCLEKQWGLPTQLTSMELKKRGLVFKESEYWEALKMVKKTIGYDGRPYHVNA